MTLLSSEKASDKKQLIKTFFQKVWQEGNADLIDTYCHPDLIYHKSSWGGRGTTGDFEHLKNSVLRFHETFLPPELQIQDIFLGEDDKVTVRWNLTSASRQIEQNEKLITTGIHLYQVKEDKITQVWSVQISNFSYDF